MISVGPGLPHIALPPHSTIVSPTSHREPTVPERQTNDQLFPLPLVPIEVMMLHDDWPHYPMSCGATFTFQGSIVREAYSQAIEMAVARHPFFRAVIRPSLRHQWVWQDAPTPRKVEWLGDAAAVDFAAARPYQLDREPGWRMWVTNDNNTTRIFCEFHHTCCDGAGGMSFMQDVFGFYAQLVADRVTGGRIKVPSIAPKNVLLLRKRGHFERKPLTRSQRVLRGLTDVTAHVGLAMRSVRPLATRRDTVSVATTTIEPPRYATIRFDRAFLKRLRQRAANQNATLNDLVIRELFLVLRQWNLEHAPSTRTGTLRIVIPMSLRTRADLEMPSTNRLSYAFLTRVDRQMSNAKDLLETIRKETKLIRRYRLPIGMLNQLSVLKAIRVGVPAVFSPNRCLATAVLSNVGDPTRRFNVSFPREDGKLLVGNLALEGFSGITALRPLTRVAFFFNTYGGRLALSSRVDPLHFTHDDACEMLDRLSVRLGASSPQGLRASA